MTDTNVLGGTQIVAPAGTNAYYSVIGGATDGYILAGDLNYRNGTVTNYKIVPSVASNNLTVAIKTLADATPSTSDPIGAWINSTFCRAAGSRSITLNAGTNWCNAGGAELAAKEIDYFVYAAYKASDTTLRFGFSRYPGGQLVSDFSSTSTNEKYIAWDSAPAATDPCFVVGRFAATLSAGAGYTWTVPTYTAANLINYPITRSRLLTFAPTVTGYSANPTDTTYQYIVDYDLCYINMDEVTSGTSNSTSTGYTMPFASAETTNWTLPVVINNGALEAAGVARFTATTNSIDCKRSALANWTNSGGKRIITARMYTKI